jgi:hypothetical protein
MSRPLTGYPPMHCLQLSHDDSEAETGESFLTFTNITTVNCQRYGTSASFSTLDPGLESFVRSAYDPSTKTKYLRHTVGMPDDLSRQITYTGISAGQMQQLYKERPGRCIRKRRA